ncbi:MAG: universal stress protein, partial [Flavisolibacter sp.]
MKRILVPTDFSDNALKAALYAAEIARKNGAIIYFVHVLEPLDLKIHQPFPLHDKFVQLVSEERMSELRKFIKPVS